MKSRHLYWLLAFGFIVALFLAQKLALASSISQTTDDTNYAVSSNYRIPAQSVPSNFSFDVNSITTITFEVKNNSAYTLTPCFEIFLNSTGVLGECYSPASIPNDNVKRTFTINFMPTGADTDGRVASWNSNTTSTKSIGFNLSNWDTGWYVYGSAADTYAGGIAYNPILQAAYPTLADLYIVVAPLITNSVVINNIATSTEAISFNWQYHLDSATTSSGYYTIFPQFAIWRQESEFVWFNLGYNFGTNSHPNSNIATGTTAGFNLDAGRFYQIKGFYLKYDAIGDGSINASTTPVDSNIFYVSSTMPFVPIITIPTSTITSSTIQIQTTCDPNSGFFSYSICSVIRYLFFPDAAVLNLFSGLTQPIQTKPPIGYFTSIKNALTGLTSSTPAFTIDIADDDPVKTTFFTPIRTGLIWILWLAFAFWIFHRFRHFNFTSP